MRLIFLLFLTLNLLNAEKLALLIGNSKYIHLNGLSSPSKDIPALAQKLRGMKFKVIELYDLDEKAMKKAIKDFKKRLLRNPSAIALFYYSGHGSQAYGESYLIPIDGDTRDEADVEADGVKVETIARKMANARTKANILFLDACRDVPTGTMGGTKGLGQVKNRPSGSLIVYSTSKNTTAKDNRLFNKVVLQKLATNVPLTTLANDISYTVDQKTGGSQVPEVFAKSLPTLCLSGSCQQQQEVKVVEKIVYRDRPQTTVVPQTRRVDSSTNNTEGTTTIDGLMYQNQALTKQDDKNYYAGKSSGRVQTWQGAIDYCSNLSLGGYADWRLPKRFELKKLITKTSNKTASGHDRYIRKEFAKNLQKGSCFWTSEEKDSSYAWYVFFDFGSGTWGNKSGSIYALCVR